MDVCHEGFSSTSPLWKPVNAKKRRNVDFLGWIYENGQSVASFCQNAETVQAQILTCKLTLSLLFHDFDEKSATNTH